MHNSTKKVIIGILHRTPLQQPVVRHLYTDESIDIIRSRIDKELSELEYQKKKYEQVISILDSLSYLDIQINAAGEDCLAS